MMTGDSVQYWEVSLVKVGLQSGKLKIPSQKFDLSNLMFEILRYKKIKLSWMCTVSESKSWVTKWKA